MFKKATKASSKVRAALFGPPGAGKTFSALRIATGLGGRIAFIDTERGSASKYADRFAFDVCDLEDRTIDGYVGAIRAAAAAGYGVLVIDSMSHGWQELVAEVDKLANAKYRGNTWSAWSEGTPKQKRLIDAILSFPGHVLCTMRSKVEYQMGETNGKARPIRIGLAPEQGKGIEYEFDLLLEISPEHHAHVLKDRTGKWQDKVIEKPGEDFGRQLAEWLSDGAQRPVEQPAEPKTQAVDPLVEKMVKEFDGRQEDIIVVPKEVADEVYKIAHELSMLTESFGKKVGLAALVNKSIKTVTIDGNELDGAKLVEDLKSRLEKAKRLSKAKEVVGSASKS